MEIRKKNTAKVAFIGTAIVLIIVIAGAILMGQAARRDTDRAIRTVSLLYLDELAGRREQVVAANLQNSVETIQIAVDLMTDEDLSDEEHLQAYQKRMKALYHLDRFAFVGGSGAVYTTAGMQNDFDRYPFEPGSMSGPEISMITTDDGEKKALIAVPIEPRAFLGDLLNVCFMEIDMAQMLKGISLEPGKDDATFCNIYAKDGTPLSDAVLGGLAVETNLLEALEHAEFEEGCSLEQVAEDFGSGSKGTVSFRYDGMQETLAYVPVKGTDWLLTYLIRETVISEKINVISNRILVQSVIQLLLTIAALVIMFVFIIRQNRKTADVLAKKEAAEAEARVKQEEMEHRLALQEELLHQKEQGEQQDRMIKALSSDYRSVYYLELDKDAGICYQARTDMDGLQLSERFSYLEAVTAYGKQYVMEPFREDFLKFIQPDAVRAGLKDSPMIAFRYMISVNGRESWEVVKFAGVRPPDDQAEHGEFAVSACFADVDAETREGLEQQQALSDALETAEQANRAKTAFLSNMSHEIRTPMNAIIGLDNIALNDPATPEKTKEYLEKIGDSAEHLLNLINDILGMSRIESGRLTFRNEEFSFSKLLEMVNTMFSGQCADKGLDYQCHINGQVDDCYIGDSMKLRQVLINILGNAVIFPTQPRMLCATS